MNVPLTCMSPIDSFVKIIKIVIGSKKIDSLSLFCTVYCFPLDVRWLSFTWERSSTFKLHMDLMVCSIFAPINSLIHFERAITCFEIKSYITSTYKESSFDKYY